MKCKQCNRLLRDGECPNGCNIVTRNRKVAREAKERARERVREVRETGEMHSFSRLMSQRLIVASPIEAKSHARHVKRARIGWRGRS